MRKPFDQGVRRTKDKHKYARLCAILARSEGMSVEATAQAHRVSIANIYWYLSAYNEIDKTEQRDFLIKSQLF